jgi:hypothetical protein
MLHVAGHLHRLWATHLRLPRGLTCHWRMVVPVIVQMRFVVTANGLRLHAAVSIMVVRGLHMWLLPPNRRVLVRVSLRGVRRRIVQRHRITSRVSGWCMVVGRLGRCPRRSVVCCASISHEGVHLC